MANLSLEQQAQRIENMKFAERSVIKCSNRVRVRDYMPGQVTYNLGPYPKRFSIRPTEYDYQIIQKLAEKGVELIQIHEEWNDSIRHLGADKFSSHDPQGLHEFIDLCHRFHIKVIPYISSNYFDERDVDFREDFARYQNTNRNLHFHYRPCSLESPTWSKYLFDKVTAMLEEYDFDGLYNDMGYDELLAYRVQAAQNGEERDDTKVPYNPCAEDMLVRLYHLCKSRGKIMKHHYAGCLKPETREKFYDYLWVGENVKDLSDLTKTAKYDPYVVPCPDFKDMDMKDYERVFAHFLPLMQFPLRADGRPFNMYDKMNEPGVAYTKYPADHPFQRQADFAKAHPNGPYMYSEWSSMPENEAYREKWFDYLAIYRKMAKEDSLCHVDIKESTLFAGKVPENVYMTLYTSEEQFLCIANCSDRKEELVLNDSWTDYETGQPVTLLELVPNKVRFLKRG